MEMVLDISPYARDSPLEALTSLPCQIHRPLTSEPGNCNHQSRACRLYPRNEREQGAISPDAGTHIHNIHSPVVLKTNSDRRENEQPTVNQENHFCCRLRSSSSLIIVITSARRCSTRFSSSSFARRRSSYVANHSSRARSSSSRLLA